MPSEVILVVDRISVFHGSCQALWDVSLQVRRGELTALIGANNSGKTTLLDAICGLLKPRSGMIEFDGMNIDGMEPYETVELGITQIPEGRCIFPEMSVLDNLWLGSYPGRARRRAEANLEKIYSLFPVLRERRRQTASTLSGGEQQMLAIGRGLMAEPRLMLIDEMSLGLAPIVVNSLFRSLRTIRESGVTILFVEQNVRKSLQEADRAYILENGRVVLGGSSTQLRDNDAVKRAYFGVDVFE